MLGCGLKDIYVNTKSPTEHHCLSMTDSGFLALPMCDTVTGELCQIAFSLIAFTGLWVPSEVQMSGNNK